MFVCVGLVVIVVNSILLSSHRYSGIYYIAQAGLLPVSQARLLSCAGCLANVKEILNAAQIRVTMYKMGKVKAIT